MGPRFIEFLAWQVFPLSLDRVWALSSVCNDPGLLQGLLLPHAADPLTRIHDVKFPENLFQITGVLSGAVSTASRSVMWRIRWLSARLQYLQYASNGDDAVLHQAIDLMFPFVLCPINQLDKPIPCRLQNISCKPGQYCSCWCAGSFCHRVISSHDTDNMIWAKTNSCLYFKVIFNNLTCFNVKSWKEMYIFSYVSSK